MEKVKCALCNADNYKIVLKLKDYRYRTTADDFTLVQCKDCGLVYLNPRPSEEAIVSFYPSSYYPTGNLITKAVKWIFLKNKIRKIKRYKKSGRLLDIGCGDGDFLRGMSRAGFETFGTDASAEACKIAQQKLENKNRIYNSNLRECKFSDNFFDVITLWHVLEHLPHPQQELKEIHRILKDEGILILGMPNLDCPAFNLFRRYWFHLDIPRHLYHFTPKTIKVMLELAGFEAVRITYFTLAFPFSLFHSVLHWLKDYNLPLFLVCLLFVAMLPLLSLVTFIFLIFSFSTKSHDLEVYCRKRVLKCQ